MGRTDGSHTKILKLLVLFVLFRGFSCSLSLGAVAHHIRTECIDDEIPLRNPELLTFIQDGTYFELFWIVSDPEDGSKEEQKLGYCNESVVCYAYEKIEGFQLRIKTLRNPVRGTLYIKQMKPNDKLTYTCRVIRKGKGSRDYTITVISSSANCLSTTAGRSLYLSRPIQEKISEKTVHDIYWYGVLQDGTEVPIAHCSPSEGKCKWTNCTGECPEYLTRLKTDGLSIILTNVTREDRGLEFRCKLQPETIGAMGVYTIRIKNVMPPQAADYHANGTTASPTTRTTAPTRPNAASYSPRSSWLAMAFSFATSLVTTTFRIS